MSLRNLEAIFAPGSIAIAGASPHAGSIGRVLHENIRAAGFAGRIDLINPRHREIAGMPCHGRITELSAAPDLVVIATPAAVVPEIVADAAARGAKVAVILTTGLGKGPGSLTARALATARAAGMRLVGPNCLGVLAPKVKLNVSFTAAPALPGDLALVSQSGAVVAAVVEWANGRHIGFSGIVSLGDMADVDFDDLLDHFALDGGTRAILLYVEAISEARRFLSAARAAARIKPVVVMKTGRHAAGARAAASHTGALAGTDAVYDAVFRRAGLLRVLDLEELFAAAEILSHLKPFRGDRLAILTNGGGVGVITVDRLVDLGGSVAGISTVAMTKLDAILPKTWSKGNPIDIIGDAGPDRYRAALDILLEDEANDAVLVVHVPTALAAPGLCAEAVARAVGAHRARYMPAKPVLSAFIGVDPAPQAIFQQSDIPMFRTPTAAVRGFMHLVRHVRAQEQLIATPPSLPEDFAPDLARARAAVERALAAARKWLDPLEVADVLAAYAIPAPEIGVARDPAEAARLAAPMLAAHGAVAIKIRSPDITHKSDVGGVRLGLRDANEVGTETAAMFERVRVLRPQARIDGVLIQPMVNRANARELITGIAEDPVFGPVLLFGAGGIAVEVMADSALALPPLTLPLAHDLIRRTRVSRLLDAYRDRAAADRDAVALVLVKLAQLSADLPEVREIDVNPLLADESGVVALDARIAVAPLPAGSRRPVTNPRFAIRPYPREEERRFAMRDGTEILVRPVRPEDEPELARFFAEIAPNDLRQRFFAPVKEMPHAFVARFTQIDYARVMVFLALSAKDQALLGIVQLHADPDGEHGEYAILVRSDLKGRGLGWQLMRVMIEYARARGLREVTGQVLRENVNMLAMCAEFGFRIADDPHEKMVAVVSLPLAARAAHEQAP